MHIFLYGILRQHTMCALCRFELRHSASSNTKSYGPRQSNLVLIAYASSEGSGKPAHLRSLARTSAARSYKQWVKRNLQTESQIPGPSEWLGMPSENLSWWTAQRHKFAWHATHDMKFRALMITWMFLLEKFVLVIIAWAVGLNHTETL